MGLDRNQKIKLNSKNIEDVRILAKEQYVILEHLRIQLKEIKTIFEIIKTWISRIGWTTFIFGGAYDLIARKCTWAYNPGWDWKQVSIMLFGIGLIWLGSRKR